MPLPLCPKIFYHQSMLINRNTNRGNTPVFRRVKRIGDMTNFSFDWKKEIDNPNTEVWRLSVASNKHTLAYISIKDANNFVEINLIERENAKQKPKPNFTNIGATLVSFACLRSKKVGFGGVVALSAKNKLMRWYRQNFHAKRLGNSNRMVIFEQQAMALINRYIL
jgi:hypothetical protein